MRVSWIEATKPDLITVSAPIERSSLDIIPIPHIFQAQGSTLLTQENSISVKREILLYVMCTSYAMYTCCDAGILSDASHRA